MGRPTSNDLRERIVQGVESGKSRRAVAAQFEVSPSTAVRVVSRYAATGSVAPAKQGRPRGSGKLGPHRAFLIAQVERQPDITMAELAAVLEAERDLKVDPSNLSKFLIALGYSYKKKPFWPGSKNAATSSRTVLTGAACANPSCAGSRAGSSSPPKPR